MLEDSIIKDGSFNIDCGVGVRAVSGEKTGFAYSDQIQLEGLKQSAIAARGIAQQGQNLTVQAFKRAQHPAFMARITHWKVGKNSKKPNC